MKIWLVTIGEPIPHEQNKLRMHRTGILAKFASEKSSHNIIWWTSDFNHFTKESIFNKDHSFVVNKQLTVITLNGGGYQRNVSIDRIKDHKRISDKFRTFSKNESAPDIIIAAFPTLGLCEEVLRYGKKNNIPVLIDYRDMWPEVFVDIVPGFMKFFVRKCLFRLFQKSNKVFEKATGIIGITDEFLRLALVKAGRKKNEFDAVFPLAYLRNQYTGEELTQANRFWEAILNQEQSKLRICFFGTLGHQFDLDTIITAVEMLNTEGISSFEIVLCGTGDKESRLRDAASRLKGLIIPGYMDAAQIAALLSVSDIGLCPYNVNKAFLSSIPGKAIEYISAGLPLLSTLGDGDLGKLTMQYQIGFNYEFQNPASLAEAIKMLLNKKVELKEMRSRILNLFESDFDGEKVYAAYLSHAEFVVKNFRNNER